MEESEKDGESDKRSPAEIALFNPFLASKILGHCGFHELFGFRLVSKAWYEATILEWRKSSTVFIGNSTPSQALLDSDYENYEKLYYYQNKISSPPPEVTIAEFLKLMKRREDYMRIPFQNFHLHGITSNGSLKQFWRLFSPHLKRLQLSNCFFNGGDELLRPLSGCVKLEKLVLKDVVIKHIGELRYELPIWVKITKMPHLKVLEIHGQGKNLRRPLIWLQKLFQMCVNVETLIMRNVPIYQVEDVLNRLCLARARNNWADLNVKYLHIIQTDKSRIPKLERPSYLCDTFETLKLPLKFISLQFTLSEDNVQQILHVHSLTLEDYEMYGIHVPEPVYDDNDDEDGNFGGLELWSSGLDLRLSHMFYFVVGMLLGLLLL